MAELRAYNPTLRERARDNLQNYLEARLGVERYRARDLAETLLGTTNELSSRGIGVADLTPAGLLFGAQEGGRQIGQGLNELQAGQTGAGSLDTLLGSVALIGAVGGGPGEKASKGVQNVIKGLAKQAARNKKKGAVGDVFDDVERYADAKRMAESGAHLKQTPDGQYVGAPRGVDSPAKLGAMRRQVDAKTAAGAFNADWYDRAREGIAAASSSPEQAAMLARGGAVYSPQSNPLDETNTFLRQYNDKVLLGQDNTPRMVSQANNMRNAFAPDPVTGGFELQPEKLRLGKKTGPYADAKDPTIPDEMLYKTANDLWHGRVFGYNNGDGTLFNRGFTPQEHGFLTGENILAAERATAAGLPVGEHGTSLEWSPRRMQAATWGAQRYAAKQAQNEAAIAKAEKALAKWERARPKTRGPKPSIPRRLTEEQLLNYAKTGIDDGLARHPANATYEFITGENTGHLAGLNRADEAARADYSKQLADVYGSRDPYYDALQMYQMPKLDINGEYVNSAGVVEHNPGYTARPLAELLPSSLMTKTGKPQRGGMMIGDASRAALDDVEFIRSALNAQEAGAWNKFTPANSSMKAFEKTGARITGSPEELAAAKAALEGKNLDVINVGDALHATQFPPYIGPATPASIIQKRMTQGLENKPVTMQRGRMETGYQEVPWGAPGSGQVTEELVQRLEGSPLYNLGQRLDSSRVPQVLMQQNAIDQQTAQLLGLPERTDLYKLRGLLADPNVGFKGLGDYVRRYGSAGLPAVLLAPALPSLLSQPEEQSY